MTETKQTMAQEIARLLHEDGTNWETDDGKTLDELLRDAKAYAPDCRGRLEAIGGMTRGEYERHELPDGSAILITLAWWDLEGSRPWVCAGAEEDGEIGVAAE